MGRYAARLPAQHAAKLSRGFPVRQLDWTKWLALATVIVLSAVCASCATKNVGSLAAPAPIPVPDENGDNPLSKAPEITRIEPSSARNGEEVILYGSNLAHGTVAYDQFELDAVEQSSNLIRVKLPDWFIGGQLVFRNAANDWDAANIPWRVDPEADKLEPRISHLQPQHLVAGGPLLILGNNLAVGGDFPRVYLGTEAVNVVDASDTHVLVTCPVKLEDPGYSLTVVNEFGPKRSEIILSPDGQMTAGELHWQVDGALPADQIDFYASSETAVGLKSGLLLLGGEYLEHEHLYYHYDATDVSHSLYVGRVDVTGPNLQDVTLDLLTIDGIVSLGHASVDADMELLAPRLDRNPPFLEGQPGGYLEVTGVGMQPTSKPAPSILIDDREAAVLGWDNGYVLTKIPEEQQPGVSLLAYATDAGRDFIAVEVSTEAYKPQVMSVAPQPARPGDMLEIVGTGFRFEPAGWELQRVLMDGMPWGDNPQVYPVLEETGLEYDLQFVADNTEGLVKLAVPGSETSGTLTLEFADFGGSTASVDVDVEIDNPLLDAVMPVGGLPQLGATTQFFDGVDGSVRWLYYDVIGKAIRFCRVDPEFAATSEDQSYQPLVSGQLPTYAVSPKFVETSQGDTGVAWATVDETGGTYPLYLDFVQQNGDMDSVLVDQWDPLYAIDPDTSLPVASFSSISIDSLLYIGDSTCLLAYQMNPFGETNEGKYIRPLSSRLAMVGPAGVKDVHILAETYEPGIGTLALGSAVLHALPDGGVVMLARAYAAGSQDGYRLFRVNLSPGGYALEEVGQLAREHEASPVLFGNWLWFPLPDGLEAVRVSLGGFGEIREYNLPLSQFSYGQGEVKPVKYKVFPLAAAGDDVDLLLMGGFSNKDCEGITLPRDGESVMEAGGGFNTAYYYFTLCDGLQNLEFLGAGLGAVNTALQLSTGETAVFTDQEPGQALRDYTDNIGVTLKFKAPLH